MPNNNETYITGLRVVKGRKKSQCLNLSNARIKSYADIEQMTEEELQGVIICPDYPLEDGHLVPSSAIGYEDGTVEDALDGLNEGAADLLYKASGSTMEAGNIDITTDVTYSGFIIVSTVGTFYVPATGTNVLYQATVTGNILRTLQRTVTTSVITGGYRFAVTNGSFTEYSTYGSAGVTTQSTGVAIPNLIYGVK